tara:strand:+ start:373 stop:579 length:207 start_codon:yes stop_codon:yes gene_type:complete
MIVKPGYYSLAGIIVYCHGTLFPFNPWEEDRVEYQSRQDPDVYRYMDADTFDKLSKPIGYWTTGDGVF